MKLKNWVGTNRKLFTNRDYNFLMDCLFGKEKYFAEDYSLSKIEVEKLSHIKSLYSKGKPIAYLLKREKFFGLNFFVEPGVLIPRPETEIIAEKALDIINAYDINSVLELGCGTSCIAIVIAKYSKKKLNIFASDISSKALLISQRNLNLHLFNKVRKTSVLLAKSNLFSAFKEKSFDLIVTNPPYVERKNIKGTLSFEPSIALDGGEDGFYFIEKILDEAWQYLRNAGYLIIEIGYNHQNLVSKAVKKSGAYDIIDWIKDYSSWTRGVILKLKQSESFGHYPKNKAKHNLLSREN